MPYSFGEPNFIMHADPLLTSFLGSKKRPPKSINAY
jgi:hypothetical protein